MSPSISIAKPISSGQTWKTTEQKRELAVAGLDSSVLSPSRERIPEFHEYDFNPFTNICDDTA